MVSTVKLPILKKGEYTLWSMRMEQYLTNTDYCVWQLRFHAIKDAKTLWAAIKSSFGGNIESKKMQKNVLKHQFENFSVSDTEGLDKAYDRFQKLISRLEVHSAAVSNEDANQKFLRALPLSWNNVALIMRNKDGIDDLDIDDLYNNLKVFEADIKGSSRSSLNSQNVAFLSAEDTSSSNEVNTANGVSTASGHNSQGQAYSSSYTDDLMFSFFANQSNSPQLDDEDLEQIDHDDLEEIDLKWQVSMLSMRVKQFIKKTRKKLIFNGKEHVGFDKTKVECFNCHRRGHFARECRAPRNQGNMNGDAGYRSRDNTRRTVPVETSDALVVQDNALIVQDGLGYDWSLESVEAQLVVHQKNEVVYEEKIAVLEFKVKDKRYGDHLNENDSSGSELYNCIFDSRSSDGDENQTNYRFKKDNGYHVVPPPLTRNYMPLLADLSFVGLDDSVYRPTVNKTSASVSQVEVSNNEDIFQSNDLQATDKPSLKKIKFTNARNESVKPKQNEKPRMITQNPKVDRRDWNRKMSQKLGLAFGFTKKACFVCGKNTVQKEIRPVWNSSQSINHQNKFVPSRVLRRSGRVPVSTAKQSSLRATASTTVSTIKGNGVTAVKALAGYAWRPKMTNLNNVSKDNSGTWVSKRGNPQQGCSRHMTWNKDFLTDYQELDGGFVAFDRSARGGKITGKGKIKIDKLDFKDVFFAKELKFNLLSVSQMCDKKNSVLFIETECLVLSPDFKLLDEI
ncbi:ribonuclease H-like domain-containing protein [Tanacetum coccineum]